MRLSGTCCSQTEHNQVETVSYKVRLNLVCGKWNLQGERNSHEAVQKPVPGKYSVNGELHQLAEQKKALRQL